MNGIKEKFQTLPKKCVKQLPLIKALNLLITDTLECAQLSVNKYLMIIIKRLECDVVYCV